MIALSDRFLARPRLGFRAFFCIKHALANSQAVWSYFQQLVVTQVFNALVKAQGARFTPHYLKILAYGGSASPQHILEEAGIDITKPSFWQGGFDFISGLLDELESGLD